MLLDGTAFQYSEGHKHELDGLGLSTHYENETEITGTLLRSWLQEKAVKDPGPKELGKRKREQVRGFQPLNA